MSATNMNERIAALSPEKRELLLKKLQERQETDSQTHIPQLEGQERKNLAQPFPLAEIQQVYWLGQSGLFDLSQGSNIYMEYELTDVKKSMLPRLQKRINQVLRQLIAHYDLLRLIILPDGMQKILSKTPDYNVQLIDLSEKSPSMVQEIMKATRYRMRTEKTPVNKWPLFEFMLHYLDGDRVILHIRVSAFLMDGTSRGRFAARFFQMLKSPSARLIPLEISYRDYVMVWEDFKKSSLYRRAKVKWIDRIPQLLPGPALPTINNHSSQFTSCMEAWEFKLLDQNQWDNLRIIANQYGVSPSNALLAAYVDLLAYESDTPRFSIGFVHTYRPPIHPKMADILGNFNTIGIIEGDVLTANFAERAKKLQWQVIDIVDSPYYSGFEVLREMNRIHTCSSKTCVPILFNSVINHPGTMMLNPDKIIDQSKEGVTSRRLLDKLKSKIKAQYIQQLQNKWPNFTEKEVTLYPPQIQLMPTLYTSKTGGISCKWESAVELFPCGFMKRMAERYQQLVKKLAAEPSAWESGWQDTIRMFGNDVQCLRITQDKPVLEPHINDVYDNIPLNPSNNIQKRIVELWRDILNTQPLSQRDNFFDLGGDSLGVYHLHSSIEKLFGKFINISDFYLNPTIEELTRQLEE